MYSPRHDSYGYMNSGFLYILPTRKSKILMKTLENLTFLKKGSDQILWNSVLRHYRFQQVQQRVLPREYFFTMWGHASPKQGFDAERVMCIHVVSIDKAKRLIRLGHWYFNESFPFYNREVLDYVEEMHLFGKGVAMERRDRVEARERDKLTAEKAKAKQDKAKLDKLAAEKAKQDNTMLVVPAMQDKARLDKLAAEKAKLVVPAEKQLTENKGNDVIQQANLSSSPEALSTR